VGWPGVDFEELSELIGGDCFPHDLTQWLGMSREAVNRAVGHLDTAYQKLEATYTRTSFVSCREAMEEIDKARKLLRPTEVDVGTT
jgi:hypothetical protein